MKRRRKKNTDVLVPVASMGDIAFLLIIFFILCSKMYQESNVRVTPPKTADVEKVKESGIGVTIDEEGDIYVMGELYADAEAVEARVESELEGKETAEQRQVMLKTDKSLDRAIYEPVMDAITKAGGTLLMIGERGTNTDEPTP